MTLTPHPLLLITLLLLSLIIQPSYASIYDIDYGIGVEAPWQGPTTEGPMYALKDFPGVSSGTPYLGFYGEAFLGSTDKNVEGNLSIVYTSSPVRLSFAELRTLESCDAEDGMMLSEEALTAFGALNKVDSYLLKGGEKKAVQSRASIEKTGFQYITFVLCTEDDTPAEVKGQLKFRNPYGYLPALLYGFLPFQGLLAVAYFILGSIYLILAIRHRDSLLTIQKFILLVIFMGFIETTTWFFTYQVMNDSGEPSCCPVRSDIVFAIVTNNVKRVVSALLVLCVSLGWGVARPNLETSTKLMVAMLGVAYLAFSLNYDMKRISDSSKGVPEDTHMAWALPVAVCDVIFVFWIYYAIGKVQEDLQQTKQEAKLEMYTRLSRTLSFWVVIWVLYTFTSIFVNNNVISLSWKYMFAMFGFWDVLYFGILISISRIWAPSRSAAAYAYSQQIPTSDVLDEFDDNALEMNAPSTASAGVSNGNHGSNDDGDLEIDIGLDNGPQKSKKSGKKVAPA